MKKNLLFIFCAIVLLAGCAQRPQLPTFQNTGNPLVKDKFTADRLRLYTTELSIFT